jgi:hypothetical protein
MAKLRALEPARYRQYEDTYGHAGHHAALLARYFEVVTEIYHRLKRELGRGYINHAASGSVDEPQQTNGVHAHADLQGSLPGSRKRNVALPES